MWLALVHVNVEDLVKLPILWSYSLVKGLLDRTPEGAIPYAQVKLDLVHI